MLERMHFDVEESARMNVCEQVNEACCMKCLQ